MNSRQDIQASLSLLGLDLSGQKVAIIGVGGIGIEVCRICAALGAMVTMVDNTSTPPELSGHFQNSDTYEWLTADITDLADQDRILSHCKSYDAAIVTVGICPDETHIDIDDGTMWLQSFRNILDLNTAAPMRMCQHLLRDMAARGNGRMVLTSSLASRTGGLISGPQYTASKGALNAFSRWLATRAAHSGVSVNCVAPGVTQTPILGGRKVNPSGIPAGRIAEPIEIARAIVFLASPAASYIHGITLDVNGGAWMG
jgi:3-oxoacyl-[acyl-carrier protein] reductase